MGQHEHDAGLPARGRRVLADVRGDHGRRRGRRHARRSVRVEGADARDGSDPGERDGDRADATRTSSRSCPTRPTRCSRRTSSGSWCWDAWRRPCSPGSSPHGGDPQAKVRALLKAFDDGHVLAWSADRRMQRGLALTTVGGAFDPTGTDAISVVTNSASGTKLDFYQAANRHVRRATRGRGHSHRDAHRRPAERLADVGVPAVRDRSVQGLLHAGGRERGGRRSVLRPGMRAPERHARRRARRALAPYRMDGYPYFEDYVRTASGDTASIVGRPRAHAGVGGRRPGRHVPPELHPSDHDPARPPSG